MIEIVLRCHNDMPLIKETLAKLSSQDTPFQLIALDNASIDGTREAVAAIAHKVVDIPAGAYIPGRVLNEGMKATSGDLVAFLNSDCTPQNDQWLCELVAGMENPKAAAVFGRQVARPDCVPPYVKDTEECYGDGIIQQSFMHMFSMASSVIRRSVWEEMPFDENLKYSEDIDWTWKAKQAGYQIQYVPESVVAHSHNFTLKQLWKRQFGEGCAEAKIFEWPRTRRNVIRYSFLPFGMQVLRDWKTFVSGKEWRSFMAAPLHRGVQHWARRRGFINGLKQLEMEEKKCA